MAASAISRASAWSSMLARARREEIDGAMVGREEDGGGKVVGGRWWIGDIRLFGACSVMVCSWSERVCIRCLVFGVWFD